MNHLLTQGVVNDHVRMMWYLTANVMISQKQILPVMMRAVIHHIALTLIQILHQVETPSSSSASPDPDHNDTALATLTIAHGRGHGRGRGRGRGSVPGKGRGGGSDSDRGCGQGRGRGRGRGCGRGRGRGRSTDPGHDSTTPRHTRRQQSNRTIPDLPILEPVDETAWVTQEPTSYCYSYTKTPGPTTDFSDDTTPLQFFMLFFTDEVWDLLVTETNKYANNNQSTKPTPRAWNNITSDEMKLFIGVLMLMASCQDLKCTGRWQMSTSRHLEFHV